MMSKKYTKAFNLLKKLHKTIPHPDEVLRYLSTQQTIKQGY